MELKCSSDNCCGCFACLNACNFNAIEIKKNPDGVLRPRIIKEKCKECGMCNSVCPQIVLDGKTNSPMHAFAAFRKNESDSVGSSSGSIASSLYDFYFKSGFKVYGVAIDQKSLEPIYMCATSESDLERFRGSKYISPNPKYVYKEIKKALCDGDKVLFIGLPCHVAALRCILRKEYDNLYTVDLVCHGTPPFEYFENYIRSKGGNNYSFRNKKGYYMQIFKDNKQIYKKNGSYDLYLSSFLSGLISKESCYRCKFAKPDRASDISIGDFHGLSRESKLFGLKRNVSLILINTVKGKEMFNSIKDIIVFEERNISESISGNAQLNRPSLVDPKRHLFLENYRKTSDFIYSLKQTGLDKSILKLKIRNFVLYLPRFIKRRILKR